MLEAALSARKRKSEATVIQQLGTQMVIHQATGAVELKALVKKP